MAVVNNEQDDQQNGPTTVGGTSGGAPASGSGAGGGAAAGASPVKQNTAPQNQAGYTDVGSYLNANQAGSTNMGNQVASNLTNRYNTTKQGVAQSSNDLINQVNQGYTAENKDLISQTASDPYSASNNPNQTSAFQSQLNDTYTGPATWGDYGTQQGNVANAQQYGNLYNTAGGTNVLAQQLEGQLGSGQASQGANQLDSLLLQGNPNSAAAIKAASDPYANLSDYLNQQNTAATGAISGGQTAAQQASQDALNAFTGANGTYTNLNNTINQNTAAQQQTAQQQEAEVLSNLNGSGTNGKQYSDATLKALGLTREQGDALSQAISQAHTGTYATGHNFGAQSQTADLSDLTGYLQQQNPATVINASTVATPEQYKQMTAIQQLLGSKTPQGSAINPALASLAGTAPTNLNQFDYNSALGNINNFNNASTTAAQASANQQTAAADAAHEASKHSGILNTIKSAISNPVQALALNPQDALKTFNNAIHGKTPTGTNPLPSDDELSKLGVKR